MSLDSFRWLTSALGLAIWFGGYATPTKVDIPAPDVAIAALENEMAAETDATELGEEQGTDDQGGAVEQGTDDQGSPNSEEEGSSAGGEGEGEGEGEGAGAGESGD